MILSHEERELLNAAMATAWSDTRRAGIAAGALRRHLEEADRIGQPWAAIVLDEALDRGLSEMAKTWWKANGAPPVTTKKGQIDGVLGTTERDEDGSAFWVQERLDLFTRDQIDVQLQVQLTQRRAAERKTTVLKRLKVLMTEYPAACTVGDALALAGMTLDEWLAAAA